MHIIVPRATDPCPKVSPKRKSGPSLVAGAGMPQGGEHTFLEFFNHGTFSTHMRPVLGNDVVPTTANRGVRGCRWAKAFTYASRGRLLCVVQPHVPHSLGVVLSNKLWNFVSDFHSASPDHDLAPPPSKHCARELPSLPLTRQGSLHMSCPKRVNCMQPGPVACAAQRHLLWGTWKVWRCT